MFAAFLLFIPGLYALRFIELEEKKICVLEGSMASVSCSFFMEKDIITEFYFFNKKKMKKWKDPTIPENVAKDFEYDGRCRRGSVGADVSYKQTIVIEDLRPTDSGEYKCRVNTLTSGWKNSKYGSTLDVTGLKVRSNPDTVLEGMKVTLTCGTKCTLTDNSNPIYIWYKNGQRLNNPKAINNSLYLDPFSTTDSGTYCCAVNDIRSPALCLLNNCSDVRYPEKAICAIEGSSVDLPCIYTYPSGQTVTQTLWSKTVDSSRMPDDLEYGDVVQYHGNKESDCTLRIKDVQKSDSARYGFRFKTRQMKYGDPFKVTLSVTDISVTVDATEGNAVRIYCRMSCTPKRHSTGVLFYKDNVRLLLPDQIGYMELKSVSRDDAGVYSCALVGLENHRALSATLTVNYPPKSTTVKVIKTVLGTSSVVLTCDSDAHPPAEKFTWYKWNGSAVNVLQGETKSDLNPVVSLKGIDQYFCEAMNKMGAQNSTRDLIDDAVQSPSMVPIVVVMAVLTTGALLVSSYCLWKRRHRRGSQLRVDNKAIRFATQKGQGSHTTANEIGSGEIVYADPDEYVNVPNDTYTALQGDPVHSVYCTIPERTSP